MTHPALLHRYPLSSLHPATGGAIRRFQRVVQEDDFGGRLLQSYPLDTSRLSALQKAQAIAFLEATPLRSRSTTCYLVAVSRPFWRLWTRRKTWARQSLVWVEALQTFLVVPVMPAPK